MNGQYAVSMEHITKRFPGVVALDNVSFSIRPGEVHALVGENGAGKSTLMKILGGVYSPDEGRICVNGSQVVFREPIDAIQQKISVIYQELNLVPTLRVSENIYLGRERYTRRRTIDRAAMLAGAQKIVDGLGFSNIDCSQTLERLSIAQQQMVEIAKALLNDSNVLVMDEPTAVLTEKESELLFRTVEHLKAQGVAIVYISHRLEEVVRLSDRITVLRDGQFIAELDNCYRDVSKDLLVQHMVGRELSAYYPPRRPYKPQPCILEARSLGKHGMFQEISFGLCKGEILGFFGLVGAGRTELMKTLYGEYTSDAGEVLINGEKVSISSPAQGIKNGLAFIPEDRKGEGLVLLSSMQENIALPNRSLVSKCGITNAKRKHTLAASYVDSLSIRPPLPERAAKDFSGGNQQKIVVAKWLAANPKIIILDEPTRGVDVYAKREIYEIIQQMAMKGMGVIVVSSDMAEIMGICDRVLVMHEGRLAGEFMTEDATQEKIMARASGLGSERQEETAC